MSRVVSYALVTEPLFGRREKKIYIYIYIYIYRERERERGFVSCEIETG